MGLVDEFFSAASEDLAPRIASALPDDVCVLFELDGEGGGTWCILRAGDGPPTIGRDRPAVWDCRLRCGVGDFMALLDGELDPRRGFLDGRLRIEGDVGLMLRLWSELGGHAGILAAK